MGDSRGPLTRKWTVGQFIIDPLGWDDETGDRRVDTDQMFAVAAIEFLERVDLPRCESLAELRGGARQRLDEKPSGRWRSRCRLRNQRERVGDREKRRELQPRLPILTGGGGRFRRVEIRTQMPVEKRPRAVPGVDLLGRVDSRERLRVHATAEGMTAARSPGRRIDIHLRLGKIRLARSQCIDDLLVLVIPDIPIVGRYVDQQGCAAACRRGREGTAGCKVPASRTASHRSASASQNLR